MKKQIKWMLTTLIVWLVMSRCMESDTVKAATQAEALVEMARSQIGVKERSADSDDILYNDWYYGGRVNNNGVSGKYAWCAVFVSWCANEAGIPTSVIPKTCNTTNMKDLLIQKGGVAHLRTSGYKPVKGDIIFFGNNASTHVGIVDYTSGNTIYYIDGNNTQTTPHGVHYSSRTFDRTDVWGFVTPNYSGTVSDGCSCTENYAGWYTVTTSSLSLNMRSGHGTGYSVVASIPKGSTVNVTKADGTWAHVTWNGQSGYCSMQYLTKNGSAPTGYEMSISSTSIYDGEPFTITITPWGDNITNYKLYIVQSNGAVAEYDMGSSGKLDAILRIVGKYKIYAKVTNAYGSYCGSVTDGCLEFEIKEVSFSEKENVGEEFYAYIKCGGFGTALTNDGSNVSSRKYTGAENQLWHFRRFSDGGYEIASCYGTKHLDVQSGASISGTNVQVYEANDTDAQKWFLHPAGNDSYYIRPACSTTTVVDIYGNVSTEGTNVNLWTKNGSTGQKFQIVKLTQTNLTANKTTLNLDLAKTKSGDVEFTAKGYLPDKYKLRCLYSASALSINWGSWNNKKVNLSLTGKKVGNYTATIRLYNSQTEEIWDDVDVKVNITCSHSYGSWTTVESATCTKDGKKNRTCSACGDKEEAKISKTGHDYVDSVVKPTCNSNGYTLHTCSKCGDDYEDSYVPRADHNYGVWETTKEATCIYHGTKERKCVDCGSVDTEMIDSLGHDYDSEVIKATCTSRGYVLCTCRRCKDSYKKDYTSYAEHDYGGWVLVKEYTNSSYVKRTCNACGGVEYDLIPRGTVEEEIEDDEAEDDDSEDDDSEDDEKADDFDSEDGFYNMLEGIWNIIDDGLLADDEDELDNEDESDSEDESDNNSAEEEVWEELDEVTDIADCNITGIKAKYIYTGKKIKPVVTVTYNGVELIKGVDYKVSYKNNKKFGKAKVIIKGIGDNYYGKVTKTFEITPKKLTIHYVKYTSKGLKLKFKKLSNVSGYQIQYSKNKKMSKSMKVTIKKNACIIRKLDKNAKYYIRVRAYNLDSDGNKIYGKWSVKKTVLT